MVRQSRCKESKTMERLKNYALLFLVVAIGYLLWDDVYNRGYEVGYWDAIEEENVYACELFT